MARRLYLGAPTPPVVNFSDVLPFFLPRKKNLALRIKHLVSGTNTA
jgi:hypothetical protein